MNKRVEKNKKLYEYVNAEIAKKAKQNSNENFKSTNDTLKDINPALFGGDPGFTNQTKKHNLKNKNLIISSIIFIFVVLLIILLAVVIFLWLNQK